MKTPLHANFDALSGKKQKELPTSYNFLVIAWWRHGDVIAAFAEICHSDFTYAQNFYHKMCKILPFPTMSKIPM